MPRILLVDDEPSFLATLGALLRKQDYQVEMIESGASALELVDQERYDLVLTDIRMAPVSGLDILESIQSRQPQTPVIMITADDSIETALAAMQIGAFDYVTKPFKVDELFLTVKRALEHHSVVLENHFLRNQLESRYHLDNIVARSRNMRHVCELVERAAPTNAPLLISGESGTGKAMLARAIHLQSDRAGEAFVPVACAGLPAELLAPQLFGEFREQSAEKTGLFDAAARGTIFFDDIDHLPRGLQRRLLRALQEKRIEREGSDQSLAIDVRIIAASDKSLTQMQERGLLEPGLQQALGVLAIQIAPLRERREDIIPLAAYFIQQQSEEGRGAYSLDRAAKRALESYDWPGNVAELEDAVRSALLSAENNIIRRDDLPAAIGAARADESAADSGRGRTLQAFIKKKESEYIAQILASLDGDKRRAAEVLNISMATLERRLNDGDGEL